MRSDPFALDVQTPPCFTQNEQSHARVGISRGSAPQSKSKEMLPQWQLPWMTMSLAWMELDFALDFHGNIAVEVAELALEAREDRQSGQSCRGVRLLHRDVASDLAERLCERTVRVGRTVTGNQHSRADDPHPGKREHGARRQLERSRKDEAEVVQSLSDTRSLKFRRHLPGPLRSPAG